MKISKLSMVVGAAAFFSVGTAFAADPVTLACPAGTSQTRAVNKEAFFCVDHSGQRVDGPMVILWPNGKKQGVGQTSDGIKRSGTWTIFDPNGVKTHEIDFKGGQYDGKYVEFHSNGQVKTLASYSNGIAVGTTKQFDATGKLQSTVVQR